MQDLQLLCNVYRDVQYSECLVSFAMRLVEEQQTEELLQSVLRECRAVCDELVFVSIIRYVFHLMDEENREDSWWMGCVQRVSLILSEVKDSPEIEASLSQQNLCIDHLERCVDIMTILYNEFSIKLMSDFFFDTEEISDLLIRGCVSESGYQVIVRSG